MDSDPAREESLPYNIRRMNSKCEKEEKATSKKFKKSSKKVLTNVQGRSILVKSSGEQRLHGMILENDTESRRTRTVIFTSHG